MAETTKEAAPIHPVDVRISIGGNTWEYVEQTLEELLADFREYKRLRNLASGGYDGSHSVTVTTRDISPDEYRKELSEWFDRQPRPAATEHQSV